VWANTGHRWTYGYYWQHSGELLTPGWSPNLQPTAVQRRLPAASSVRCLAIHPLVHWLLGNCMMIRQPWSMTPLIFFWLFVVADAAVQTPPTFRQTLHCCSELPFHDFAPAIVSLLTLIAAFISRRHSLSIGELQNSEFSWHRVFCQYVRKVDKHRARTATLRRQLLACWQNWTTHVAAPNWPVLAARVGSPRPWFKQYEMMLVIGEMSHDDGADASLPGSLQTTSTGCHSIWCLSGCCSCTNAVATVVREPRWVADRS